MIQYPTMVASEEKYSLQATTKQKTIDLAIGITNVGRLHASRLKRSRTMPMSLKQISIEPAGIIRGHLGLVENSS